MLETQTMTIIFIVFLVVFTLVYLDFQQKKGIFMQDPEDYQPFTPVDKPAQEEHDLGIKRPTLSELPHGAKCCKDQSTYAIQEQISKFPFFMPRQGIYAGDRFRVWSDCFNPLYKDKPQNVII